jgi:hypothetical protein
MAAGWLVAAGSAAFSLVYFSEIKGAARDLLGLQAPSSARIASADRSANDAQLLRAQSRGRFHFQHQ